MKALTHIRFYVRYYRLIALAVAVTVAVITGSLFIGQSVRYTLLRQVDERLGHTQTILFARYNFMDARWARHPLFNGQAEAVFLSDGFISDQGRLIPVTVWGMDGKAIDEGYAKVNQALADELHLTEGSNLILRLPATGLIPSGSLFVTDTYTTETRMLCQGVLPKSEDGNLNLKNEQIIPYNIFVRRSELTDLLKVEGKANLMLINRDISADALHSVWTPEISGLRIHRHPDFHEIVSDQVFIPKEAVQTICRDNPGSNRLFSYLANSLATAQKSIPYSFVTAVDRYKGHHLQPDEIILSDYTAWRLQVNVGDSISLSYYYAADNLKTLREDSLYACVIDIVPIAELVADTTLSANFPGLSDVERCTEWDSDLPIDMARITTEDEDYWNTYRATPKAILSYAAVEQRWSNAYGSATAIRTNSLPQWHNLNESMMGLSLIHPRETALRAALESTDFSSLFLGLGFFIIIAALMLMLMPLSEMLSVRRPEFETLHALGFSVRRIRRRLYAEVVPVVAVSSLAGIAVGILYTLLILFLLGNVWQGATQMQGFALHLDLSTLVVGWLSGMLVCMLIIPFYIQRSRLILRTYLYNRKRALLSFITIAAGVFIVFIVGLHRQGFADGSQLSAGTGGYDLWVESRVPIYHHMSTDEGRAKLSLTELPPDVAVLQLLRYLSDDASCLNLNKVSQPTVLGIDMAELRQSQFRITRSLWPDKTADELWQMLACSEDSVIPALVDETVLQWTLMRQLGDTIRYRSAGQQVCLRIAGTLANSIFQGHLIIDKSSFEKAWPDIAGSEICLLKVKADERAAVRQLLEQSLYQYGVRVESTASRLQAFNRVTDTYLSIFLTLGGFGLLLGMIAFVVAVRKDLVSRRMQIGVYRAIGFSDRRIRRLLVGEAQRMPLLAVCTGAALGIAGSYSSMPHIGTDTWVLAGLLIIALLGCMLWFIRHAVAQLLKSI